MGLSYQSNWLQHVTTINNSRMSKVMLNYRPNERRRIGRPWKGLLNETETGLSSPNWWPMMMIMMVMTMLMIMIDRYNRD